jgi:hypothetical protein
MPPDKVHRHIASRDFDRLLAADELTNTLAKHPAFAGWHEGIIDFPPTFKFIKGTGRYVSEPMESRAATESGRSTPAASVDTAAMATRDNSLRTLPITDADDALAAAAAAAESPRLASAAAGPEAEAGATTPSPPPLPRPPPLQAAAATATARERGGARVRTPAWTDRILFRTARTDKLISLLYESGELTLSDHKPVIAAFLLNADVVDKEAVHAAIDAAQRSLDMSANNAQPRCTVSGNVHDAGTLRYGNVYTSTCSVHNQGEVRPLHCILPRLLSRTEMSFSDSALDMSSTHCFRGCSSFLSIPMTISGPLCSRYCSGAKYWYCTNPRQSARSVCTTPVAVTVCDAVWALHTAQGGDIHTRRRTALPCLGIQRYSRYVLMRSALSKRASDEFTACCYC